MPTLQQTAVALTGAVTHLEVQNVKPGSTRATVSMGELGSSAGVVFNHLEDKEKRERQAIANTLRTAEATLKDAQGRVKDAKSDVESLVGAKDKAAAELELSKASAAAIVAMTVLEAAKAHAKASQPASAMEDKAVDLQIQAENSRDKADTLRVEGDEHIAEAKVAAERAIAEANEHYDETLAEIEEGVRSVMGV
jgi:multidrug efflux pump subunit AcrB